RRRRRIETGLGCQRREERNRAILDGAIFAVRERHVEEPALVRPEPAVESLVDRVLGCRERAFVAGERVRRSSIDVARELIEDDDARERPVWVVAALAESTGAGGGDRCAESIAKGRAQGRTLAKPKGAIGRRQPAA